MFKSLLPTKKGQRISQNSLSFFDKALRLPQGVQEALDAAVINSDAALKKAKEALDAANAASGTDLSNYVKKTDLATPGGDAGLAKLY